MKIRVQSSSNLAALLRMVGTVAEAEALGPPNPSNSRSECERPFFKSDHMMHRLNAWVIAAW